jgi:hypothetical protein
MGWTAIRIGGKVNHNLFHEIIASKRSDINSLPIDDKTISFGSEATVLSDGSKWILDEDGTWVEVKGGRTTDEEATTI